MKPGRDDLRLLLARLPSVHAMQRQSGIGELRDRFEDGQIDGAIRRVLRDTRDRIRFRPHEAEAIGSSRLEPRFLAEEVAALLEGEVRSTDGEPINASGILFHPQTRGWYAGTAARRASKLALTLAACEDGGRTSRLLRELTGAEDGLVARSVATAFLVAVRALAEGEEVVIGRGHTGLIDAPYDEGPMNPVSICGFAGARVVETGATNKTRMSDYCSAVGDRTALIITARPSTYALRGFTEEAGPEEIVRSGADSDTRVLHLAGDTTLRPVPSAAYPSTPSVAETVRWGTPLIVTAGGGLIGGPPCGLLIGSRHVIARIRRHSLWPAAQASRHVRAGLDARLAELAGSPGDLESHPAAHMLAASQEEVGCRARQLLDRLTENGRRPAACSVVERQAHLTAYRLPGGGMPSFAVALRPGGARPEDLARRWAKGTPALLVDDCRDRILIDMRGVEKYRVPDVARIVGSDLKSVL